MPRIPKEPRSPDCYEYVLDDDWHVLAGRTDVDNEALSLRVAKAKDWWFHVRGLPGSHVILRHRKDAEPGKDILEAAAAIAAWHSKARQGGRVAVSMTQACNVSKAPRTPVGTVHIKKERVLKVRPGCP